MWTRVAHLFALALALSVAIGSATSVHLMTPDRQTAELQSYELVYGPLYADLCGSEAGHDHRCSFCHGLPEAPEFAHQAPDFLLTPHDGWRQRDDLYRAAQARNISHSPRAPPVTI